MRTTETFSINQPTILLFLSHLHYPARNGPRIFGLASNVQIRRNLEFWCHEIPRSREDHAGDRNFKLFWVLGFENQIQRLHVVSYNAWVSAEAAGAIP